MTVPGARPSWRASTRIARSYPDQALHQGQATDGEAVDLRPDSSFRDPHGLQSVFQPFDHPPADPVVAAHRVAEADDEDGGP